MGRVSDISRYIRSYRRLIFGDITLVPFADRDWYPYNLPRYAEMWHVPGRLTMSTDALVSLATKRGLTVTLLEHKGSAAVRTQLN